MTEHARLLMEQNLTVPPKNPDPKIIIQNEARLIAAWERINLPSFKSFRPKAAHRAHCPPWYRLRYLLAMLSVLPWRDCFKSPCANSIKYDAFITTAYMRHGSHQFNGLTKRDWKIFGLSLFISNLYWTLASFMGVTLIEYAWKHFFWWTIFRGTIPIWPS